MRHPRHQLVAQTMHRAAHLIDTHGPDASRTATLLAARGWPTNTNHGGSRAPGGDDPTAKAALTHSRWNGVDERLARLLRILWAAAIEAETLIIDLQSRAASMPEDQRSATAGTGACGACNRWCSGAQGDRLRSGWCPACFVAWRRWARGRANPDRAQFQRWRRRAVQESA